MNSLSPSNRPATAPAAKLAACVALTFALLPGSARATGDWNSINLLADHQFAAIASPEFWLELELKELARSYPTTEKFVPALTTTDADLASFEAAVKAGKVDSAEVEQLRAQLKSLRASLPDSLLVPEEDLQDDPGDGEPTPVPAAPQPAPAAAPAPLPQEEFALYQRGAEAYHAANFADAQAAWKALLALPEAKRHYRSTWAAYMLGRSEIAAMKDGRPADVARGYFQQARALAGQGFDDPQGLAAASYGWEAYTWLEDGADLAPLEKALELYLKQLATGDTRAFASIKSVIRRRFFPDGDFAPDPAAPPAGPTQQEWAAAAKSPLLRQLITRWHLAMGGDVHYAYYWDGNAGEASPAARWLTLIENNAPKAEDADRLGWIAYRNGAYDQAERWLALAPQESRLALWLTAKLALRAGDVAKAEAALAKVEALFAAPEPLELTSNMGRIAMPRAAATADHAAVLLGEAKFTAALTEFIDAGFWQDAAYIAERVLTLAELQAYVAEHYPAPARDEDVSINRRVLARVVTVPEGEKPPGAAQPPAEDGGGLRGRFDYGPRSILEGAVAHEGMDPREPSYQDAVAWRLRWLLGRRMVREDQEAASRPFLPRDVQPALDAYVKALATAADKGAPRQQRAKGWWTAAWLARHAGLELMGTELYPDGAWDGGIFDTSDIPATRRVGAEVDYELPVDEDADATTAQKLTKKLKFGVPPSAEEKRRLAAHKLPREYRFHYRWVAAALAKKAAALLPDGSEEKADVLNQAGSWMFSRDVKGEEWFFFEIKRTCPKTKIGKAVLNERHTFPTPGPWSGSPGAEEN